tara:strand:- start:106 stop:414 length:309 start_codon:yes stop_codon:yes gene_type:complete
MWINPLSKNKIKIIGQANNLKHKRCLLRKEVQDESVKIKFTFSRDTNKEHLNPIENNLIENVIKLMLNTNNERCCNTCFYISKEIEIDFIHFREKVVYIDIK